MHPEAAQIMSMIMTRITSASTEANVAEISRLTPIAKRVEELGRQSEEISSELRTIETSLEHSNDAPTVMHNEIAQATEQGRRGELRIEIDWRTVGIERPPAKVQEPKGSETLVAFISELHAAMGDTALEKLTGLPVSRGPLVSLHPSQDFANRRSGGIYAHHQIPGTKFYVLTHSATAEKFDAISAAWRFLKLPPSGLKVTRAG